MIVVSILLLLILAISIYQLYVISKLKSVSKDLGNLQDVKYFELKYQIESYVKIGAVIVSFAAYLGYNTYSELRAKVSNAFTQPLDTLQGRVNQLDSAVKQTEVFIKNFDTQKEAISKVIAEAGNDAKGIQNSIEILAKSKLTQAKVYVSIVSLSKPQKIYFKDLKVLIGGKLPKFTKAPIVVLTGVESSDQVPADNMTTESFELKYDLSDEPVKFYALILSDE